MISPAGEVAGIASTRWLSLHKGTEHLGKSSWAGTKGLQGEASIPK